MQLYSWEFCWSFTTKVQPISTILMTRSWYQRRHHVEHTDMLLIGEQNRCYSNCVILPWPRIELKFPWSCHIDDFVRSAIVKHQSPVPTMMRRFSPFFLSNTSPTLDILQSFVETKFIHWCKCYDNIAMCLSREKTYINLETSIDLFSGCPSIVHTLSTGGTLVLIVE